MFELRPYQRHAVGAVVEYFRHHSDPAVVVLPTGAGKSLVIAELARLARGRVLVLTHVKELVQQNQAKYQAYGNRAGIFSAGLQRKEADQQVVFGSVQSVARGLQRFGAGFTLLVIDECHRLSLDQGSEYQRVLRHLRDLNPNLKILGLTATPYRLGMGWIYRYHHHGMVRGGADCFFKDCIFELSLRLMVKQGYLTPPQPVDGAIAQYDFGALKPGSNGRYTEHELNGVVKRAGRATAQIISQVVQRAASRQGVMIFAATVDHAEEVFGYLPAGEAALIVGATEGRERDRLIQAFKARQLKYLVNVSVLTTGFDAPHVDLIAILRPTESVSLYQQIVGRGLRLSPGKADCLVLDYAGNDYDLYAPEIGAPRPTSECQPVMVFCPQCQFANTYWGTLDQDGDLIEHYGRRCHGVIESADGRQQCTYRFRFKECQHCNAENDIAARRCQQCRRAIVDPDTHLQNVLALRDARVLRCAGMSLQSRQGRGGSAQLQVIYHDEDGSELAEYFNLDTEPQRRVFQHRFVRQHLRRAGLPLKIHSVAEALDAADCFRAPDFVIARKQRHFWVIKEKLFDYQGRYRQANQL